jgi:hypothetical protein
MRPGIRVVAGVLAAALLAGCDGTTERGDGPTRSTEPTEERSTTGLPSATASARPTPWTDPRWHFYTGDRRPRTSPWFTGRHRVMIPFGCTPAPYYDPDPRTLHL